MADTTLPPWLLTLTGWLERIFWTFLLTWVTYAASNTLGVDTAQAAALAGLTAVVNLVALALTSWAIPAGLPWTLDALVRVARTYAVAVLALILAGHDLGPVDLSLDAWETALAAALPTALTAIKAIAAERLGALGVGAPTAATLPRSLDPQA